MAIVQVFKENTFILTNDGIKNISKLKTGDDIFDINGNLCKILRIDNKILPTFKLKCKYNTLYIGEFHELSVLANSDLYKTKTINRSKFREMKAFQKYNDLKNLKCSKKISVKNLSNVIEKSRETIYNICKKVNIIIENGLIDLDLFIDKYIEYEENVRLNRIKNSKMLKNIPNTIYKLKLKSLKGINKLKYAIEDQKIINFVKNDTYNIDPYILGYWLGDGFSESGIICAHFDDSDFLKEYLNSLSINYKAVRYKNDHNVERIKIENLYRNLRLSNLLKNKHIPENYLFGSKDIRFKLLAGLIDSDGCVDKNGNIDISFSKKDLAFDVYNLIKSLGIHITNIRCKIGKYKKNNMICFCKECYKMSFTSKDIPLNLLRKKERLLQEKKMPNKKLHNFIESYEYIGENNCYEFILDSNVGILPQKLEMEIFKK